MDNFWQQHRAFILKIGAGLLVVLVCWIVGASLTEKSLADAQSENESLRRRLSGKQVPTAEAIDGYAQAAETLDRRILEVASRTGETRKGEGYLREIFIDILKDIGLDTPENREKYMILAQQNPKNSLVRLSGEARTYLVEQAGPANVILDEEIGFGRVDFDVSEAARYLLDLRLIVRVLKAAIEERVYEVKNVVIGSPPLGKFEGEQVFMRQYPVSLTVRGPSASVLRFLERLNDPKAFIPLKSLRKLAQDRNERDEDVLVADLDIMALQIDPESELAR